jgi:hypothetical protein
MEAAREVAAREAVGWVGVEMVVVVTAEEARVAVVMAVVRAVVRVVVVRVAVVRAVVVRVVG